MEISWQDKTPFEAIKAPVNLQEEQIIAIDALLISALQAQIYGASESPIFLIVWAVTVALTALGQTIGWKWLGKPLMLGKYKTGAKS
ncbi:MAG: DUF2805 domain-containing protein [Leptolyngbyaceae cyanobacterium MO_188.B28]|nr:DUF2805 domain-containing protein [Leptolyngbyaceae cyanobacterium MO_188.B28]